MREVIPVVDIGGENGFGGLGCVHRLSWIVLVSWAASACCHCRPLTKYDPHGQIKYFAKKAGGRVAGTQSTCTEWNTICNYRGLVDFVLAGRRVSVVREERERVLCGLTGSNVLARIFSPEQFFPEWVQHVQKGDVSGLGMGAPTKKTFRSGAGSGSGKNK